MKLVVTQPFTHDKKAYSKGDQITDPKLVKAIQPLHRAHVVPVNTK